MKDVKIATIVMVALILMVLVGCFDDAQTIMKPVLNDPIEPSQTMGEVKSEIEPMINDGLIYDLFTHEHYFNGVAVGGYLPMSAWILDFPGPYREHTPPESSANDFLGQVCMEVVGDAGDEWAASRWVAPVSDVVITITHGPRAGEQVTTDEGGYYLFHDVDGDELYLRVEREYLEPKEVIVSRSNPTMPQRIRPNQVFFTPYREEDTENIPGIILVGLQWPDIARFVLENELLPHDMRCVMGVESPITRSGSYGRGRLSIINRPEDKNDVSYGVIMHELAHARQHADSIVHGTDSVLGVGWESTPEGKSYQRAWDRDLEEAPGELYLIDENEYYTTLIENNAEFCNLYWLLGIGVNLFHDDDPVEGMRKRAPNRFKWAQTYLNAHPTN